MKKKRAGKGRAAKNAQLAQTGRLPMAERTKHDPKSKHRRERHFDNEDAEVDAKQTEATLSAAEQEIAKQPHSFVVHTGDVGKYVKRLERDLRDTMAPNTAAKLKVTRNNNFKDFVVNAPALGVTHIMALTRSEQAVNLRMVRLPQGPTLFFKVEQYSLARDVRAAQKKLCFFQKMFQRPALLVTNGFNIPDRRELIFTKTFFQNMFPSVNIDTVRLAHVRRVVLVNYNKDTDVIEFRHFSIKTVPTGVSKSTKKIIRGKIPNLAKYEDISEFFLNPGQLSETEFEGDQPEVTLPQNLASRGCAEETSIRLRVAEIGPRMSLKLVKIQEGIDDGEVLYHAYIKKTPQELQELRQKLPLLKKKKTREEKAVQHNVIRKLARAAEEQKVESKEFREYKEDLIRKQKAVTGDYGEEEDDDDQPRRSQQEDEKDGDKKAAPKRKRLPSSSQGGGGKKKK